MKCSAIAVRIPRLGHRPRYTCRPFSQRAFAARHPSPSAHKWSHPPSSTTIADDEVAGLASKPLHALSLADLVKHGRPPLSTEALFSSANFTLSLLPIRLAHRIQALRNLPFIVVSNPNISKIYNNYLHSLSTLLPYKEKTISNLEDEIRFTSVLADLVETHSHTIPTLARGFLECRKYINPLEVTRFLDEHLRARIGTRLIAEQHIALHVSSQPHQDPKSNKHESDDQSSYIGVIDTALQPASIINSCGNFVSEICELKYGVRPTWIIDGEPDTTFAFVPVHLEYIITELLKNAFRATVESGKSHEPVIITIAAEPESPRAKQRDISGGSPAADDNPPIKPFEDSAPGVTIRIRDRGGGISPDVLPNIWSYSFTTFSDDDELPGQGNGSMDALNAISGAGGEGSSIAGLGYGLPLSRAYAEYFGGGIAVQSLYGWGCDVYLRLKGLGKPKG
ncbi:related to branched-chain alpha-ketoacid dehydrogenase kinase, mitochondrial precursor [Phialocephala subalpina]|uniref:Protein-serine/threonine kinase n=1 Tax=Phialocephala subalpina TaxID=576137 RepID=A0A1L7XWU0_9HELO|nr:related to branched-chain alpha-ketoacid dehydrogenase kinase, mitochondrial precursor [Phialocephala subalpina]